MTEVSASAPTSADIESSVWPEEVAEFVAKQPSTHGDWRVIDDQNHEHPTYPRGVNITYTKIEAGKLPTNGSERLFSAENVREGQFGYIEGRNPEGQPQRKTSEWEHPASYYLDKPDYLHTRRDYWYDNQGRPIAKRTARYPTPDVPYLGVPQNENVDYITRYRYTEGDNQAVMVQQSSISRAQRDKELRWSEPQSIDSLKREILLPPKQKF